MDNIKQDPFESMKLISKQDFLHFGVDQIAYIKSLPVDKENTQYGVYSADGKEIVVMDSYPTAIALVRQNDLYPVQVH